MNLQVHPDGPALAEALAARLAGALRARLARDGVAAIALSGGRTPAPMLARLAQQPLDWPKVSVTLVDERWVPESSPRSNAALVRRALAGGPAAGARFVPLYTDGVAPDAGRALADAAVAALPRPFAAVVLGVGDDGHTASFFPGGDRLADALAPSDGRCVETLRAPGAGEPRVTLTLPAILATDLLVIHVEGDAKRDVLARAAAPGPVDAMPVRAVLRQTATPFEIHRCP